MRACVIDALRGGFIFTAIVSCIDNRVIDTLTAEKATRGLLVSDSRGGFVSLTLVLLALHRITYKHGDTFYMGDILSRALRMIYSTGG